MAGDSGDEMRDSVCDSDKKPMRENYLTTLNFEELVKKIGFYQR